ncbi:MAG: hypothetical protein WBB07_24360 [Mycobacterium sp.]
MQVTDAMVAKAVEASGHQPTEYNTIWMRAALTAAMAELWRPIEEAPINQAVLVKTNVPDHYGNAGVYEAMLVDMGSGKRWHTFGYAVLRDIGGDFKPTHFMPLPTPPKTGGE